MEQHGGERYKLLVGFYRKGKHEVALLGLSAHFATMYVLLCMLIADGQLQCGKSSLV